MKKGTEVGTEVIPLTAKAYSDLIQDPYDLAFSDVTLLIQDEEHDGAAKTAIVQT